MDEEGDHFSLDIPAHVLAYVRAQAFHGAEEARQWLEQAEAMLDLPKEFTSQVRILRQFVIASRVHVAYLRVLASTVEMYTTALKEPFTK